jgi:hypothetical protein
VRYLGRGRARDARARRTPATFAIDARGRRFRWRIRKVGSSRVVRSGVRTRGGPLRGARAGHDGRRLPLQGQHAPPGGPACPSPSRAPRERAVLVVLPVMTWQGRNPVDDDGDGAPDVLDRGVGVRLDRVYAGDGLPAGFATHEAPVLSWLDAHAQALRRHHRRRDRPRARPAARGAPRRAAPRRHALAAAEVQRRLRRFVRRGGRVATLGVDSLRRQVR